GVCFGYSLYKETGPNGKPIGTKIEINEEQAKVVRWIHAAGRRIGWKDSTIRAMLHNESYIGRWRYRARQWRKVPGTNRRVPVRRDTQQAIVDARPHLRIIDEETWTATHERLKQVRNFYTRTADGKPKGRAVPARATPYLFSSLLVCGVCGSKMV